MTSAPVQTAHSTLRSARGEPHRLAQGGPWRNRIVRSGEAALSEITANPVNWRTHPKLQADALAGVLSEVGFVQQVVINTRTGHLVDGHLRVALAEQHGETSVPAVWVDLDDAEERLILLSLDPLGAMAETDAAALAALLESVSVGDDALRSMLDRLADRNGLGPPFDPQAEWQGMPAFEHEDESALAAFTIRVFLKDGDDLAAFGRLLGKDLTGRKFVWFSKQPHGDLYEAHDEMAT